MRRRELHGVRASRRLPNVFESLVDLVGDVFGNRHELAAPIRESDGLVVPVEQGDADPFFEQPDPSAEGRLRHIPPVGGPGETARLNQRQKIFKPCNPHCRVVLRMQPLYAGRHPNIRQKSNNFNREIAWKCAGTR